MNDIANLMLNRALDFYGLKEIPGPENNPTIMGWFKDLGFNWVQGDETSWCSCFINWLAMDLGLERSGKLDARSWMRAGSQVDHPEKGHVVVLWREDIDSWKGHVGLFIRKDANNIWVLGGNQSNSVNISPYPKDRLLDYRELNPLP